MDGMRTGVWAHPVGGRIEITEHDGGWRAAVFRRRGDQEPGHVTYFGPEQAAEMRDRIAALEAQGHVHQAGVAPGEEAGTWSPVAVVGTVVLLAILITALMSMR